MHGHIYQEEVVNSRLCPYLLFRLGDAGLLAIAYLLGRN